MNKSEAMLELCTFIPELRVFTIKTFTEAELTKKDSMIHSVSAMFKRATSVV